MRGSTTAARVSGMIKALEWEERTDIDGLHNAESPIGWWFNIRELSGGRAQYEPPPIGGPSSMRSVHPCIEAAKAVAQADYEGRILAAIQPDPDPQPLSASEFMDFRRPLPDHPYDEQFDNQSDVEANPCGAWAAIQHMAHHLYASSLTDLSPHTLREIEEADADRRKA